MSSRITNASNSRFRAVVTAAIAGIAFLLPGFSHAGPVSFQFVAEVSATSAPFDTIPIGALINGRVTYDATSLSDTPNHMSLELPILEPVGIGFRPVFLSDGSTPYTITTIVEFGGPDIVKMTGSGGVFDPGGANRAVDIQVLFSTTTDVLSSDAVPDPATLEQMLAAGGMTMSVLDASTTDVLITASIISVSDMTVDPISGAGTATIDGALGVGEWDFAAATNFGVIYPDGSTDRAILRVMNDADNLYVAVTFPDDAPVAGDNTTLFLDIDNLNDGLTFFPEATPEDAMSVSSAVGFVDFYSVYGGQLGWMSPAGGASCSVGFVCQFVDTDDVGGDSADDGTNDGAGAIGYDGVTTTIELSHPLDSDDNVHDMSLILGETTGIKFILFLRRDVPEESPVQVLTFFPSSGSGTTDKFVEVTIGLPLDPAPEAVDDFATADCGVDENIFVLENDLMLFDAPFVVSAQTATDKGGTTVVKGSPNADPAAIFVTYTPPPGFDGTDTFEYTVTDENGTGESDTATVTVEVDGSSCQIEEGDTVIFNPDPDSDLPITAVVQEVVKAGTITQTSCVIEDDRGTDAVELNLVLKITDPENLDCIDVAAKLDPTIDKATLKTYQRAFGGENNNKIVVTLIRAKDPFGEPADLTKGVVISEEDATKQLGPGTEPLCNVADVSDSPSTVGVNLSFNEPSGDRARNWTGDCNRSRSFGNYSDHLLAFPIRNVSSFLPPIAQANQEAGDFRLAVIAEQEAECVDSANKGKFLRDLMKSFNAAWRLVGRKKYEEAIDGLIATTLIALDVDDLVPDPYGSPTDPCPNDPKGHLASRLMDLTYQVHRGLLHPGAFEEFIIDEDILAELPAFPPDTPIQ